MLKSIASLFGMVENGPQAGSFPMQRRAKEEVRKAGKPEEQSFAGVLQPMAAGKAKAGETPYQILIREIKEELGGPFAEIISQKSEEEFFPIFEKEYIDKDGDIVKNYNYFTMVSKEDLKKIKLHSGAEPELVFLKKEDIKEIKTINQIRGKEIKPSDLVMFSDQLEALKGVIENLKR